MSLFSKMMLSLSIRNLHNAAAKTTNEKEEAATSAGVLGGAIAGDAIGSIFGPAGAAIGLYLGSKAGAEGVQAGIKGVKEWLK